MIILLVAAALRCYGLFSGVPMAVDPRERIVVEQALRVLHQHAAPEVFNWPGTVYFHALAVLFAIAEALRGTPFAGPAMLEAVAWARAFNVILGLLTIALVAVTTRRRWGDTPGLPAGAMLAVAMLHATNEGQYALVDIPAGLLGFAALAIGARDRPSWLWPGVVAGLAMATKFTAVVAVPGLLVLAWTPSPRELARRSAWLGLGLLLGFSLGCPYVWWDLLSPGFDTVRHDLRFERGHFFAGHFGLFAGQDMRFLPRTLALLDLLRWGVGTPLAALWLAGLFGVARNRDRFAVALAASAVAAFVLCSLPVARFPRHLLLVYPHLACLAVWPAAGLARRRWGRLLLAVVLLHATVWAAAFARQSAAPPTRLQAGRWLAEHDAVATVGPDLAAVWLVPEQRVVTRSVAQCRYALLSEAWVAVHDDWRRQPERYPATVWSPAVTHDAAAQAAFDEQVRRSGRPVARFAAEPGLGPWRVDLDAAPPPFGILGHPRLTIYELGHEDSGGDNELDAAVERSRNEARRSR